MLSGKTALVTGSIGGIGYAAASALAAQGCNVMLNGFADPAEIEERRSALEKAHGIKARYNGADLRKIAEIPRDQLLEHRYQKFRRIGAFFEEPPAAAVAAEAEAEAGPGPEGVSPSQNGTPTVS